MGDVGWEEDEEALLASVGSKVALAEGMVKVALAASGLRARRSNRLRKWCTAVWSWCSRSNLRAPERAMRINILR